MNEESKGRDLAEIDAHPLIRLLAEITAHRQSLELAGSFDLAEIDAGLQKLKRMRQIALLEFAAYASEASHQLQRLELLAVQCRPLLGAVEGHEARVAAASVDEALSKVNTCKGERIWKVLASLPHQVVDEVVRQRWWDTVRAAFDDNADLISEAGFTAVGLARELHNALLQACDALRGLRNAEAEEWLRKWEAGAPR